MRFDRAGRRRAQSTGRRDPSFGGVNSVQDLYVNSDIEAGGDLFVGSDLYLGSSGSPTHA
jgi:hypothetical protein